MIDGSCLCGGVKFQVAKVVGSMEICHCNRCRKKSGSSQIIMARVLTKDFKFTEGIDLINSYAAPLLYSGSAYKSYFCSKCGSPTPPPKVDDDYLEIPAGLFDNDPGQKPDKHIFIEFVPSWDLISDNLPQYTFRELIRERYQRELPESFELKSHYDST